MSTKDSPCVLFYTQATLTVFFPEYDVCCQNCIAYNVEDGTRRRYCKATGESLIDPAHMIGGFCPLKFKTKQKKPTAKPPKTED